MASKRGRVRPGLLTASEKKKRRTWYEYNRNKARVYIGEHLERWNIVKDRNNLVHNTEVAGFLIDWYFQTVEKTGHGSPKVIKPGLGGMVSTPAVGEGREIVSGPGLSAISASSSQDEHTSGTPALSGVEEMPEQDVIHSKRESLDDRTFLDPFELTIEADEISDEDANDLDYEDYDPGLNITIGPKDCNSIAEVSVMESVFGTDEEYGEDELHREDVEEEFEGTGIQKVLKEEDASIITEAETVIVYLDQLLVLAKMNRRKTICEVKGCNTPISIVQRFAGSAVFLTWICENQHTSYKWSSQPLMQRNMNAGDLMIASAILASGNNFQKIQLFARFLRLRFLLPVTFHRMQTFYLVPSIEEHWKAMKEETLFGLQGKEVVLLGDGRMDSPGHSAQYCTYTFIDNASKKIVTCQTLDKRETQLKSTNMELEGFIRALDDASSKLNVVEVVTDGHMQISKVMKTKYKDITHQHDVWHAAKNFGNKLQTVTKGADMKALRPWKTSIIIHFWHSCETAKSVEEFKKIWLGIQHHAVDEHQWLLSYGDGLEPGQCSHGRLQDERQKDWLVRGSVAHNALSKLVVDKRRFNKIPYWLNFRSTSECEVFHNHLLMYAAKRYAYVPPVYRARNLLAAMDYNVHVDRPVQLNKNGDVSDARIIVRGFWRNESSVNHQLFSSSWHPSHIKPRSTCNNPSWNNFKLVRVARENAHTFLTDMPRRSLTPCSDIHP